MILKYVSAYLFVYLLPVSMRSFSLTGTLSRSFSLHWPFKRQMPLISALNDSSKSIPITQSFGTSSCILNNTITGEPKGLVNLRNTCYINAILQSIFHVPIMRDLVLSNTYTDNSIGIELQRIFQRLSTVTEDNKIISPVDMITKMNINVGIQEDAQEFLLKLIDKVDDSLDNTIKDKNVSTISSVLQGIRKQTINCLDIDYNKTKIQKFYDLSVDLSEDLIGSIKETLKPEYLLGDNGYQAGSNGIRDAMKTIELLDYPRLLIIQIKRFAYDVETDSMEKKGDRFEFPNEFNTKDIDGSDSGKIYTLSSIVIHEGTANFGHYTSIVRRNNHSWYLCNDQNVQMINDSDIGSLTFGGRNRPFGSKTAYLLFYSSTS